MKIHGVFEAWRASGDFSLLAAPALEGNLKVFANTTTSSSA
jgi:hypothetical protein